MNHTFIKTFLLGLLILISTHLCRAMTGPWAKTIDNSENIITYVFDSQLILSHPGPIIRPPSDALIAALKSIQQTAEASLEPVINELSPSSKQE